ncbi:hypothetical protein [Aquamicrobium sp. LC103]|uniref:hypothetical protein n=1 Tax=Aquamicrobium sp. LC103 TaxID=1120658 RepID=UPI00063EB901|nr:hypothetical protein [Aquamicrobium sp. LC103]TKT80075.1 hypothetical protein XW59_006875 [Aquamicrobium sp. LC103]
MKPVDPEAPNLILDNGPEIELPPSALIDSPKVDEEMMEGEERFNWKPTIAFAALAVVAMLAFAYL